MYDILLKTSFASVINMHVFFSLLAENLKRINIKSNLFICSQRPGSKVILCFMCGNRGGWDRGSRPPPHEKSQYNNIGFLSNTDPDPLKITKLPSQHSMLGHHRHASETPFKWRFAGGSMMAFRWRADDGPILVVFGSTH